MTTQQDSGRGRVVDDGGPAFPLPTIDLQTHEIKYPKHVQGMKLRDYFAAQAGAAMYANSKLLDKAAADWKESGGPRETCVAEWFAGMAYEFADAMLAARKQVSL